MSSMFHFCDCVAVVFTSGPKNSQAVGACIIERPKASNSGSLMYLVRVLPGVPECCLFYMIYVYFIYVLASDMYLFIQFCTIYQCIHM